MTKNRGISITSTYHSTHIWCFTWTDFWTIRKTWISNASTPCLPPARCKISHHNHSTLSLWTLLYAIHLRWFQFLTWAYGGTWPLRNPGKFAFLLASFSQSDLVTNFREAVCRSKEQKAEPALNLAITHCYDFIRARHARKSRDPQTSNTEVCQNVTSVLLSSSSLFSSLSSSFVSHAHRHNSYCHWRLYYQQYNWARREYKSRNGGKLITMKQPQMVSYVPKYHNCQTELGIKSEYVPMV